MLAFLRTPKGNRYGTVALIAAVLVYGAWQDLSTPERRAALNAEFKAKEAAAALEETEMAARGMCQEAVTFHTQQRAKLGWGASARMANGDFIIKQPFSVHTLGGKREFEARCTLRANGVFDVLMVD